MTKETLKQIYNQAQTYHKAKYNTSFHTLEIIDDGSISLVSDDRWGDPESVSVEIDEILTADLENITALRLIQEEKERQEREIKAALDKINREKREKEQRYRDYQKLRNEFEQ